MRQIINGKLETEEEHTARQQEKARDARWRQLQYGQKNKTSWSPGPPHVSLGGDTYRSATQEEERVIWQDLVDVWKEKARSEWWSGVLIGIIAGLFLSVFVVSGLR